MIRMDAPYQVVTYIYDGRISREDARISSAELDRFVSDVAASMSQIQTNEAEIGLLKQQVQELARMAQFVYYAEHRHPGIMSEFRNWQLVTQKMGV